MLLHRLSRLSGCAIMARRASYLNLERPKVIVVEQNVSAPDSAVRAGQHEDINLITLLIGASADGLQVLNKQNEWVSVTALPNHIVVNVGDMLQRLTNGRLKSTTHRVVNPPKEKWGTSRYSIPFFLHPRSEMRLDCLPDCIPAGEEAQFSPISAGEYLEERLIEIGLLKKK